MDRVRSAIAAQYPDLRTFFSSGSMVDAILNSGMPAPIDVQVNSRDLDRAYSVAQDLAARIRELPGVGEVYIPQDMNYPALRLDVDRVHAAELGLTEKEIVDNVITALNSNMMIAPNYWVDHKTGNDYFLTRPVLRERQAGHPQSRRPEQIPLRGAQSKVDGIRRPMAHSADATRPITVLGNVVNLKAVQSPTEVDHYQIQRVVDVYVTPVRRGSGQALDADIQPALDDQKLSSERARQSARNGAGNERVVQEFRHRLVSPSCCCS